MNTYSQPVKYVNKVFRRTDRLGERAKTMKGEKNQSSAFFLTLWVGMQNGPRFKEVICKRNEKCLIWWGAQTKAWNSQWKWLFVKKKSSTRTEPREKVDVSGIFAWLKALKAKKHDLTVSLNLREPFFMCLFVHKRNRWHALLTSHLLFPLKNIIEINWVNHMANQLFVSVWAVYFHLNVADDEHRRNPFRLRSSSFCLIYYFDLFLHRRVLYETNVHHRPQTIRNSSVCFLFVHFSKGFIKCVS